MTTAFLSVRIILPTCHLRKCYVCLIFRRTVDESAMEVDHYNASLVRLRTEKELPISNNAEPWLYDPNSKIVFIHSFSFWCQCLPSGVMSQYHDPVTKNLTLQTCVCHDSASISETINLWRFGVTHYTLWLNYDTGYLTMPHFSKQNTVYARQNNLLWKQNSKCVEHAK